MTLEELRVLISAEVAPLQKGIAKATSSVNKFSKTVSNMNSKWTKTFTQMGKMAAKLLSAAYLFRFGKEAIQSASDLEEWQNVVSVAFGEATDDINEWAETLADKFGIIELQAKKLSSTFMSMSNAEGVATKKGIIMSKNLTQLAGDMASFYNAEVEETAAALESVFTGTTLSMKKYGIVLTEANLNQFALEKGLGKTVEQMNQAEKATLRYNYIMEKMAKVQGDFSRTSGSWANQVKILKQNFSQLFVLIGNALTTILAPAIAMLNNLVSALIRVAQAIASLFGAKVKKATSGVSGGVGDIGDSLDNATGSAKELKAQLASFDELDILKEDKGSGGGFDFGGGGGWDVGDLYDVEAAEAIDGIKLLNEKLEEWNKKLKENYDAMVQAAYEWGKKFNDAFLRIRWDLIGEVLANGLDIINGSINAFIDALDLDAFGRKFAEMFNHFFQELNWVELGKSWGNGLKILTDIFYGFFDDLNWVKMAQGIEEAFQAMFDRIPWEKMGLTVAKGLNGITTVIMEWSENFPIRDYINRIWLAIKTAFENVDWKQLGQAINKLIIQAFNALQDIDYTEIGSKIKDFLAGLNLGQIISEFIKTELNIRSEFWSSALGLPQEVVSSWLVFKDVLKLVFGGVSKLTGSIPGLIVKITGITTILSKLLLTIPKVKAYFEGFSGTVSVFGAAWKALKDSVSKAWGAIKPILSTIGGFFKTTFGAISLVIVGAITAIANFIDQFKNGFNAVKAIFTAIGVAIAAVGAWLLGVPAVVAGVVAGIIYAIAEGVVLVKEHWEEIKQWLAEKWEQIKTDFWGFLTGIANTLKGWLTPLSIWSTDTVQNLVNKLEEIWTLFKEWLAQTWEAIKQKVQEIWTAIKDWLINLVNNLKDAIVGAFNMLRDGIKSALDGIKSAFSTAWSNVVSDTKSKFQTLVSNVEGAVSRVGSAVGSMLSRISSGISSAWSSISSFVSSALSKLASVSIPHLAGGGVLNSPTVALMGEYAGARTNPEIVSPESKLREIYNESNQETVDLLGQVVGILSDIYDKDTTITIGDDTISAAAARGNRNYKLRTGRSQFAL